MKKKLWNYSVSTNTVWTSFDYGQVEADTWEEAFKLAEKELKLQFDIANEALESVGLSIDFDASQIEIDEVIGEY